jgi:hypothetical protein
LKVGIELDKSKADVKIFRAFVTLEPGSVASGILTIFGQGRFARQTIHK